MKLNKNLAKGVIIKNKDSTLGIAIKKELAHTNYIKEFMFVGKLKDYPTKKKLKEKTKELK